MRVEQSSLWHLGVQPIRGLMLNPSYSSLRVGVGGCACCMFDKGCAHRLPYLR